MNTTQTPIQSQHTTTRRSLAPDLARGLMLALIAVANVMLYLHARPYGLRQHIVEDGALDQAVTAVMVTLVDGRAYPLFAVLFGYGLARILANQKARGLNRLDATRVVRRRSWWLLAFGLVHAVLGFSGDILGWYGLIGVVLASRMQLRNRTLLWTAGLWLLGSAVVQGLVYADPTVSTERSYQWSFGIEDPGFAALWRLVEWLMNPVGMLAVVSAVLVGIWAGRRRILETPADHRTLLVRTAALGLPLGALGGLGMALATVGLWTPPQPALILLSWLHIVSGVLCGFGYVALIALWADRLQNRSTPGPVIKALSATGERSLSGYLAQSVVFVLLLPAWSLGLGATLGTAGAALLGLATWALTVVAAALLARSGRKGPAEALLRRLTYGQPKPHRGSLRT